MSFSRTCKGCRFIFASTLFLIAFFVLDYLNNGMRPPLAELLQNPDLVPLLYYVEGAFLLASDALLIAGVCIAGREGDDFKAAKWLAFLRLFFSVAYCVFDCFLLREYNYIPDMLNICASLCAVFIWYHVLGGVIFMSCSLADRVTLSMAGVVRVLIVGTYALLAVTRVVSLLVTDAAAGDVLMIVNLAAELVSAGLLLAVLYRASRMKAVS